VIRLIGRFLSFLERVLYPHDFVMVPGRFESFILGVASLPERGAVPR
jgi:hypothetical protein